MIWRALQPTRLKRALSVFGCAIASIGTTRILDISELNVNIQVIRLLRS